VRYDRCRLGGGHKAPTIVQRAGKIVLREMCPQRILSDRERLWEFSAVCRLGVPLPVAEVAFRIDVQLVELVPTDHAIAVAVEQFDGFPVQVGDELG